MGNSFGDKSLYESSTPGLEFHFFPRKRVSLPTFMNGEELKTLLFCLKSAKFAIFQEYF